jgi:hypothetical protein
MNVLLYVWYAAWVVQTHARHENYPYPLRDLDDIVARMMEVWSTRPYAFRQTANDFINGSRKLFDEVNKANNRHSETVRAYVRLLLLLNKARNGRQGS